MIPAMALSPPVVLSIAGSDCSAGAGLQADLKTFSSYGLHGLTAVTAVVAETPLEVREIHPVSPAVLQEQLDLLLSSYPVAAVKTGMLGSSTHVVAVAEILESAKLPLVVDPVMVASSGRSLMADDALGAYQGRLLPLATVLTPNLTEAMALLDEASDSTATAEELTERLAVRFGAAALLTGGHQPVNGVCTDFLFHDGRLECFDAPWLDLPSSHGTGCTLSAAITAGLARGVALPESIASAKRFVTQALENAMLWTTESGRELIALQQCQAPAD